MDIGGLALLLGKSYAPEKAYRKYEKMMKGRIHKGDLLEQIAHGTRISIGSCLRHLKFQGLVEREKVDGYLLWKICKEI